ncbi:hypothetical protein [Thiomonas sp.]|uniref:hypothetical protein n=1 Tax=Thiomonas sp. TaxID=2047785 RepID=UPI002614B257|nr:hypothetical protein [Thiomonas sp.]
MALQTTDGQAIAAQVQDTPTASYSAVVPPSMAGFVTQGGKVRYAYSLYFQAPTAGPYLLIAQLSGGRSATASIRVDQRADAVIALDRTYSALWNSGQPPQAGQAPLHLAAGLHRLDVTVDTDATTAGGATLDLYLKQPDAAMPAALVPQWTAAPTPNAGASHAA